MSCTLLPHRSIGDKVLPIPIDAVLTETHVSELNITLNPIETGADVADHAHIEPKELQLHAAIDGRLRVGVLTPLGPIGPATFAADTSWYRQVDTTALSRLASACKSLVDLQESRQPFAIVTGLTMYKNMLIESLSVSREQGQQLNLGVRRRPARDQAGLEQLHLAGDGEHRGACAGSANADAQRHGRSWSDQPASADAGAASIGSQLDAGLAEAEPSRAALMNSRGSGPFPGTGERGQHG